MRLYLDNCCFNRPFDDQSQMRVRLETEAKLAIQNEVRDGLVELAWSYLLDFENSANPSEERRESIARWRRLAATDTAESEVILDLARAIHQVGLKELDALHIAAAISLGCDIFLTTDDGILKRRKKISGIRILNPIDYYANPDD
ncbi:MAG: PIN domain-containing protein [Verrucomicrobiae bacterium]|nr:PIN domain-containing protein [Verrucomicrobiae bacterium]MCB1091395.1 PIN domain-containing protein [Verrucomicrobiae bacterium]